MVERKAIALNNILLQISFFCLKDLQFFLRMALSVIEQTLLNSMFMFKLFR